MTVRIAVDTLGGDNPPKEIAAGVIEAAKKDPEITPIIIGPSKLATYVKSQLTQFEFIGTEEFVNMDEKAVVSAVKQQNISITRAMKILKDGKADAVVSPGNTGATVAAAIKYVGRIKKVRPALTAICPTENRNTVLLLDVGAAPIEKDTSIDKWCKHYVNNALMGLIYAKNVLEPAEPRVKLLNIGKEKNKGPKWIRKIYTALEENLPEKNFQGNIEADKILKGEADVVVTDGFIGNIGLKFMEGTASTVLIWIKNLLRRLFPVNLLMKLYAAKVKNLAQSARSSHIGGAPLLGVKKPVIVAHGSSNREAIKNACFLAKQTVTQNIIPKIERELNKLLMEVKKPN